MRKGFVAALLAAMLALAGCANVNQWDNVFRGHAAHTYNVPPERMGVLFGSISMMPRDESITAISLHLQPLGDPRTEILIFASNRALHLGWRTPDVDTPDERSWSYSGQLPAGQYEIIKAGISVGNVRNVYFHSFQRPLRIQVKGGASVYLGRWEINGDPSSAPEPKLRLGESDVVVRDAFAADRAALEAGRTRNNIPHPNGVFDNALAEWIATRGKVIN